MRLLSLGLLVACAGDPEPKADDTGPRLEESSSAWPPTSGTAPNPVSWAGDVGALIASRCAGCHGGEAPSGELDLATAPLEAIIGVTAVQADMALVECGDHLYSYLWHKVNGSQSIAGGSGTNMPIGAWLDDDEIALLAEWIDRDCP